MHHFRFIRRVALGAALAGAAIGAVPAMAGAASTCAYSPPDKQVFITEDDPTGVRIRRVGSTIAIQDSFGSHRICANSGSDLEPPTQATVFNTDRINVTSKHVGTVAVTIDQSAGAFGPGATPETDGISEIETAVTASRPRLKMIGTPGPDLVRVGPEGINFGYDMFGTDNDVDIRTNLRPDQIVIDGRGGDDIISGHGILNGVSTRVPLVLDGGNGSDFLRGGLSADNLLGGAGDSGNDELYSNDGVFDSLQGGPGFDTAVTDAIDGVPFNDVENRTVAPVGSLRLAPRVLSAENGGS